MSAAQDAAGEEARRSGPPVLPMVAAGEEARHAGAEARRRREFWGEREPVLTISLRELPVGFKRTDRLSLRIPQLTEKGFPPLPLTVIIQSKHSTDLGKQRASLFKRPHGPPDDGAETEGGAVKKSKVNIDGGEWREGIGWCEFVGSSPEVDAEESENAMPAAQGEQAATAPQEDPQEEWPRRGTWIDEEWPWPSLPGRHGLPWPGGDNEGPKRGGGEAEGDGPASVHDEAATAAAESQWPAASLTQPDMAAEEPDTAAEEPDTLPPCDQRDHSNTQACGGLDDV